MSELPRSTPAPSAPEPRPSGPFVSGPSDQITGLWVVGTVTRGGPGPCYGLQTDDGRELALNGAAVGPLSEGERVRVLVRTTERPADCGPGEPMIVMDLKPAN